MIISKVNKYNSTIRIHDDFCENKVEDRLSQLNYIVTESYKRRNFEKVQVINNILNEMPQK